MKITISQPETILRFLIIKAILIKFINIIFIVYKLRKNDKVILRKKMIN